MRSAPLITLVTAILFLAPGLSRSQTKIVGGTDVDPGQYRWMTALLHKGTTAPRTRHFSGGSLIHPSWVLTAAHSVVDETESSMEVLMNFVDFTPPSGTAIPNGSILRNVKGIYVHPNYEDINGNLVNDIALLLLSSPVGTITPIAYSNSANAAPPGTVVRALGWGDTRRSPRFPNILQMVDLRTISVDRAIRHYGVGVLNRTRHLAAIGAGRDTCQGDSGGPLFDLDGASGNPLLVGITSYGLGCAEPDIPGIYTNVGPFSPWIDQFLAQPTINPPVVSVSGKSVNIPNGTTSTSVLSGTNYGPRRIRGGRYASRNFALANAAGTFPLVVREVRTTLDAFAVTMRPNYVFENTASTVRIRWRAPYSSRRGKAETTVTIITNDPSNPVYTFNLSGKYRKSRPF